MLGVIADLGNCQHKNGETVETLGARVEHIFARLDSLKCTSIADLKLAVCQRAFLHGAYSKHESLNYMQQKLKNNEKNLLDRSSPIDFVKEMTEVFVNYDVYSKRNNQCIQYDRRNHF